MVKKVFMTSVSIKKRKIPSRTKRKIGSYYERTIYGFKVPLRQKVIYFPESKKLLVRIDGPNGEKIGNLSASIRDYSEGKEAVITWKGVKDEYQKKGLATQMLTETLEILKKAGVEVVSAQVISGLSIYKKLGFESRSKFGERWVFKQLKPRVN